MKKILSMLVVCALLLATLGITASAAAFYDYGNLNVRVTVPKSYSVKIDGVISEGEYAEYTDGYTEWYVHENASDYFAEAEDMAKTAKWYFSWDGKYLNIAAKWNAGPGADQDYPGGYIYSDKTMNTDPSYVRCDNFLGYGPGINVVSSEISPADEAWTRFYYVVGENTATGEKIHGTYSSQNGQNMDYKAEETDFDFTYSDDGWVTAEYRIPIIELCETFKENQGNQMFKASILLQAGLADDTAEVDIINTYSWGVRLGQYAYNSDSGNLDKVHATFRLTDDVIEGPTEETIVPPTTDTIVPPTTDTIVPPTTDTIVPPTTGGNEETIVPPPYIDDGMDTTVPPTTGGNDNDRPIAPPTGDIMVVAAVVSAISACGVVIAKRRK